MSWLAGLFRRTDRACARCRVGPAHMYDPAPDFEWPDASDGQVPSDESAGTAPHGDPGALLPGSGETPGLPEGAGTPVCNGCLAPRLDEDFRSYPGRCLVFEPALGPETLIFRPFEERSFWDELGGAGPSRGSLARLSPECAACGGPGRFLWVPVEEDADAWPVDLLASLKDGSLNTGDTLCGGCAAQRLCRTIQDRGLVFESIIPPRDGDGALLVCPG